MINHQQNMIHQALQAIAKQIDLKTEIQKIDPKAERLEFIINQIVLEYHFHIREKNSTIALETLKDQMNDLPLLYVSDHISPEMARDLYKLDIQYMDMAGNAWLKKGPLLVLIKGNKPVRKAVKPKSIRVFKPAGIKMVFALMNEPNLIKATYREIANTAGIALGNVGQIFKELETMGYLYNMGQNGNKLQNHKKLLDRWCIAYMENLYPKLFIGAFNGPQLNWQEIELSSQYAQWGGEPGAALLDQYLKPEILTIYVNPDIQEKLILRNKLYRDNQGSIILCKRFWRDKTDLDYVPPILIYAELMASNEQRNFEAAKRIYENHILQHFEIN